MNTEVAFYFSLPPSILFTAIKEMKSTWKWGLFGSFSCKLGLVMEWNMTHQFNYCVRIVSPQYKYWFRLLSPRDPFHYPFRFFFLSCCCRRHALSHTHLSPSTTHLSFPPACSTDCPFFILLTCRWCMSCCGGKDWQRNNEYELLPWVHFCSSVMIALLYMHACTLTVNGPWNYTQFP